VQEQETGQQVQVVSGCGHGALPVLTELCVGARVLLQEEERERRADFVPDVSAINTEAIEVREDNRQSGHSTPGSSTAGVAGSQQGLQDPSSRVSWLERSRAGSLITGVCLCYCRRQRSGQEGVIASTLLHGDVQVSGSSAGTLPANSNFWEVAGNA
jgi:hypothetical protein